MAHGSPAVEAIEPQSSVLATSPWRRRYAGHLGSNGRRWRRRRSAITTPGTSVECRKEAATSFVDDDAAFDQQSVDVTA
jgi:hypothetical protein